MAKTSAVAIVLVLFFAGVQGFLFDHSSPFDYPRYMGSPYRGLRQAPPCPQYLPMSVSRWARSRNGGDLSLRASLPGVASSNRRVRLSEDESTLHVRAFRPVPARGRACLPRDARLSADGRFEVFESTVPMPPQADASKATVRDVANGLHIEVPVMREMKRRVPARAAKQADASARARGGEAKSAEDASAPAFRAARAPAPARAPEGGLAASPAPAPGPAKPSAKELALAQGVHIEDEEYPWPEKSEDASEGWWDNRGEFQYY